MDCTAAAGLLADPLLAGTDADATAGDAFGADALALALIADADAYHRAAGHAQRVRLAVDAGDAGVAIDLLATFILAVSPDNPDAQDLLASAIALVAGAFPDIVLPATRTGMVVAESAAKQTPEAIRLTVHPNPGVGNVTIQLPTGATSIRVGLYDLLGRRVALLLDGGNASTTTFDVSGLTPGVYLIVAHVQRDGALITTTERLTVVR